MISPSYTLLKTAARVAYAARAPEIERATIEFVRDVNTTDARAIHRLMAKHRNAIPLSARTALNAAIMRVQYVREKVTKTI